MSFEVLEHTADVRVRVFGRDFRELLKNAALALMSLITDRESVRLEEEVIFKTEAETSEELLIKMLSEILYLHETEKMVFADADMELNDGFNLSVRLRGEKTDLSRHELLYDIKAATYHNLKIERADDRFMAEIIFDI